MVHASGAGCEGRGNLCQFGQHRCGDVHECHLSFMKVGGGPPVHLPGKTLGSVRAATSLSSLPCWRCGLVRDALER
jgi:hypothetical protein